MSDVKFDIEVTGIKELKEAAANFDRLGKVSAKLSAQYKPLGAQTTRLVQEQKRLEAVKKNLTKAVDKELISKKQMERAYAEEVRVSKERILTDKKLIAAQKDRLKKAAELQKNNERLTRTYAPLRAAETRYLQIQKEIETAHRQGVITLEEKQQALDAITKQFRDFQNGVATGGNQFARFNVETYKANKRLNTLRTQGLQQAGYQVGDFAVQVQSGTNVAIAFGQQMSQLLGVFGPAGALAGAAVAIGTAFIAPLIDAAKAAKDLKGEIEKLGETINKFQSYEETLSKIIEAPFFKGKEAAQAYFTYLRNQSRASIGKSVAALLGTEGDESSILGGLEAKRQELLGDTLRSDRNKPKSKRRLTPSATASYSAITETMIDISEAVRPAGGQLYSLETMVNNLIALSERAAKQNIPSLSEAIRDLISGNAGLAEYYQEEVNRRAEEAIKAQKEADEAALKRNERIVAARQALREGEEKKRQEAAKAFQKTTEVYFERERALLRKRRVAQNQISDQEIDKSIEIYNKRKEQEEALAEYRKKAQEEEQKYLQRGAKLLNDANDKQKELNKKAEDQLQIENQKIASLNAQVDAIRAGDAQAKASRDAQITAAGEIKRIQLEKLGYEGESLGKLVAAEESLMRAKFNLADATEEARELARALQEVNRAKEGLSDFGADIAKRLLVAQAQLRGLGAGKSGSTEGLIAGLMADARAKFADIPEDERTPEVLQTQAKTIENILALKKVLEEIDRLKESGKASQKELDALTQYLSGLEKEKRILQETLGLSQREADIKAKLIEFEEKHGKEKSKLVEERLREIDALENAQKRIDSIGDTIESSFGDAMMTIVTDLDMLNGSFKDFAYDVEMTFRQMAIDIIQQLYKVLFVETMVSSISGAVKGAISNTYNDLGNVGKGGYDGGGYTGSGPRSGGLDGKGGFLAMLHPRETVIDHTKGQGMGRTVVNQTFNISANTSDDTKRLVTQTIQQASAGIVKSSVGAVMNQRRRGGSMKATFG